MYQEQVKTLPLDKEVTSLEFIIGNGEKANLMTVGEIAQPLGSLHLDLHSAPDFGVRGIYQNVLKKTINRFHICNDGPDILWITGVPKNYYGNDKDFIQSFILEDTLFRSYWEDTNIGYLFQITKRKN